MAAPMRPAPMARFIADYTYVDATGERRVDQRIFERVFSHIARAERLVVLDMFLFNHFAGDPDGDDMRPLSRELTQLLVERKRTVPDLRAIVITDPINTFYGSFELPQLQRLRRAGVDVVVTDLGPLRDSNPAWSGLWRLCCEWLGNDPGSGWLPNPIGDQDVTLRGLLALANFKANHRKTLVADTPTGWVGLVTSGNPHDASSAHSNIAVEFRGAAALDLLETERAVAAFSAPGLEWPDVSRAGTANDSAVRLQIVTEATIRDAVLDALARSGAGDRVDLAMFYLSHRAVIEGLVEAHRRGAR
ncbi:MAG: phospholipase, partial [Wenzhouxiangellaceae bacterium]|nr:phospholipase [Wenzhouxiangellaceae bacterium]